MNPDRFRSRLASMRSRSKDVTPVLAQVPTATLDGTTAVLRLYDPVDSWDEFYGVSAKEFAQALDELPSNITEIRLHINSPGGDVFDGVAIVNALRSHPARVVAVVDGLAASAASFIATSADETIMSPNSELMIHDAWGLCVGNAAEMIAMAEMLDHISVNIATMYADKAGGTVDEWRAAMEKESWYSADEAVAAGLADSVGGPAAPDAEASARYDLSIFTYAGRSAAPAPDRDVQPTGAVVNQSTDTTPEVIEAAAAAPAAAAVSSSPAHGAVAKVRAASVLADLLLTS
jgi:ATP-dependent Clp endopeptidase proteolytic subunit ClpP